MRELRERESSINSLHRQLHTLSRMLNEARVLLEDKQNVLDIEEYLKKCEVRREGGRGREGGGRRERVEGREGDGRDPEVGGRGRREGGAGRKGEGE